jgi:dihydrolipoamide dehydrogenase
VDEQIAKEAKKAFDKQGLKIELGVKIGDIKTGKKGVSVAYTNARGEAVSWTWTSSSSRLAACPTLTA